MNMKSGKRQYTMKTRAKNMAQNDRNILNATAALWIEIPLGEITLEKVAERSGVTVRTLLRKYGSKEQLIETSIQNGAGDFEKRRNEAPPGDVPKILEALLDEYEQMGEAVIRTIAAERELPAAGQILERGRTVHRKWCATVFAPFLPNYTDETYNMRLDSFISATEIYLWKLLRKDYGRSKQQTSQVFHELVRGLINNQ